MSNMSSTSSKIKKGLSRKDIPKGEEGGRKDTGATLTPAHSNYRVKHDRDGPRTHKNCIKVRRRRVRETNRKRKEL